MLRLRKPVMTFALRHEAPPSRSARDLKRTKTMNRRGQIVVWFVMAIGVSCAEDAIPWTRIAPMQQELARIGFVEQAPSSTGMLYHYAFATNHYSNENIRITAHVRIFGQGANDITAIEADVSSEAAETVKEYAQQFLGYISMMKFDDDPDS